MDLDRVVWRFRDLLPIVTEEQVVTLREGNTPLYELPKCANALDPPKVGVDADSHRQLSARHRPRPVSARVVEVDGARRAILVHLVAE